MYVCAYINVRVRARVHVNVYVCMCVRMHAVLFHMGVLEGHLLRKTALRRSRHFPLMSSDIMSCVHIYVYIQNIRRKNTFTKNTMTYSNTQTQ